jgi:transcriptional regulator with XRE-family HTH domain
MNEEQRKRELRAFLMSRRARLTPADVGLGATARRRTPGLRREDVAELAGISTAWYTAFEMAKDNRVSMRMIGSVAHALRLNTVELSTPSGTFGNAEASGGSLRRGRTRRDAGTPAGRLS